MTRYRGAKVCNNLATDEIDDHRIQFDYKCTFGLQIQKDKNSVLGIACAWWRLTTPMTTWPPRLRAPSTQRTWNSTVDVSMCLALCLFSLVLLASAHPWFTHCIAWLKSVLCAHLMSIHEVSASLRPWVLHSLHLPHLSIHLQLPAFLPALLPLPWGP